MKLLGILNQEDEGVEELTDACKERERGPREKKVRQEISEGNGYHGSSCCSCLSCYQS